MKRTLSAVILAAGLLAPAATAAPVAQPQPAILDELPDFQRPALWFGDKAPKLHIKEWIKGDAVDKFKPGGVYVVEFWATWCGPCIREFPNLSKKQKEYGDSVQFIGVNIWERVSGDERAEKVRSFVAEQGDNMSYTVALEEGKKMSETWMDPAKQNGIPAAFIVDQRGRIAWIGHPAVIAEPLEQILKGEYDMKATQAAIEDQMMAEQHFDFVMMLLSSGQSEKGYKLLDAMLEHGKLDNPYMINSMVWTILTRPQYDEGRNYDWCIDAAKWACDATEWKSASIIDTLARAYWDNGQRQLAIDTQRKAVEAARSERETDAMQQTLDQYLAEMEEGKG